MLKNYKFTRNKQQLISPAVGSIASCLRRIFYDASTFQSLFSMYCNSPVSIRRGSPEVCCPAWYCGIIDKTYLRRYIAIINKYFFLVQLKLT